MMNYDLLLAAQKELEPGEKLLWSGQPDAARMSKLTIPMALFGIPWTAFSIFWVVEAADFQIPDFNDFGEIVLKLFPLFGAPFVLVGFGLLAAPYWAYKKAVNTIYAITNRRIFIATIGRSKQVESYTEDDIGSITRIERANGSGDIVFGSEEFLDSNNRRRRKPLGFYGIPNAHTVERLLLETFKIEEKLKEPFS